MSDLRSPLKSPLPAIDQLGQILATKLLWEIAYPCSSQIETLPAASRHKMSAVPSPLKSRFALKSWRELFATIRTTEVARSVINKFPAASTATQTGLRLAAVAGPPSPVEPVPPLPATVDIEPARVTFCTRPPLPGTAIYR